MPGERGPKAGCDQRSVEASLRIDLPCFDKLMSPPGWGRSLSVIGATLQRGPRRLSEGAPPGLPDTAVRRRDLFA
eukprot:13783825-Alexandrium_andersonii.AAC.1